MISLPSGAFQIMTVHNEKKKVVTKCFRNMVRSSDLEPETILGIKKILLQVHSATNLEGTMPTYLRNKAVSFITT